MKVLIIDYSIRIVERLEEMLFGEKNVTYIYKAASYSQAMNVYKETQPDIVLLDICLPGDNSFKILREIKKPGSKTFVIILAVEKDNYVHEQCNSLGADFFFDKYSEFEKIPRAVKAIINTAQ
jgi:DNA-binding NarL/FixJ family response regulator